MDLEKELEGVENKENIISWVKSEIDKANFEGQKKANRHAKNTKERYKDTWGRFEINPDDEDFEDKVNQLADSMDELKSLKDGGKKTPEYLKLERELKKISDSLESERKEKEDLKRSNFSKSVRDRVLDAMKKNEVVDDDLADLFMNRLNISDHNQNPNDVTFTEKFESKTIFEGIKDYIDSKPHFKKSSGHAGGGSAEGKQKSGTFGDQQKLSPMQKIALAHSKKG